MGTFKKVLRCIIVVVIYTYIFFCIGMTTYSLGRYIYQRHVTETVEGTTTQYRVKVKENTI